MKIANYIAEKAAKAALAYVQKSIDEDALAYKKFLEIIILEATPLPVVKAMSDYKDYLNLASHIRLTSEETESPCFDYHVVSPNLPKSRNTDFVTVKHDQLLKAQEWQNKLSKDREVLKKDIEKLTDALTTLGTLKRITEQFPEMLKYLPKQDQVMKITVDVEPLKHLLKPL